MSINKRRLVAYDDIEESTDAKRIRYEGYSFGTQEETSSTAEAFENGDEQLGAETEEADEDVSLETQDTQKHMREATKQAKWKQQRHGQKGKHGPSLDNMTGMRTFIPGLDDEGEQSDADEETADALKYLRSVR